LLEICGGGRRGGALGGWHGRQCARRRTVRATSLPLNTVGAELNKKAAELMQLTEFNHPLLLCCSVP
jgi:hypothetical protein